MPITVAIVEDNVEIREMLTRTVERAASLTFLQSYSSGEEALEHLPTLKPDVVIMDIQLPGITGVECTARLKSIAPAIQVLVFTVFGDADLVFKALEAGASGYLLKRTPRQEIVDAVKDVWFGGAPMSGEIARKVIVHFQEQSTAAAEVEKLTGREREVLELVAHGFINKEIADRLGVSVEAVRWHLKHIYAKLHVHSRTEAALKLRSPK